MHIHTRNVNTGFQAIVSKIHSGDVPTVTRNSRNGRVLQVDEPVMVTYTHPRERVLFNGVRDVNCFFHLYESLWMLAGRNDVAPLAYYVKRMDGFSDDGKTLNGAYGYRWRNQYTGTMVGNSPYVDQLDLIVQHLKANPASRRAVLQMWNVRDDLLKVGCSRGTDCPPHTSKDVCCLAPETKFRSPEGDTSIATLAARFQTETAYKFPVYTIDTVTGDQRMSWMTGAWKTGVKKTLRLRLDDGSSVRLTADHIVFRKRKMFEGRRCIGVSVEECPAGDLQAGDSLLAEMPESAEARISGGYRMFKRNVYRNTSWDNMVREHREYHQFATGEENDDEDIHHINEVKTDNRLSNLEMLTAGDHQRRHKMGSDNPHCKMSDADKQRRGRIHSAVMQSGGKEHTPPHIREILGVRPPYRTTEQSEALWEWVCSVSNHKVVAVEDGGYAPVYDFTVPGRHNAVLSNGVLVHNCNLSVMFSLREGERVEDEAKWHPHTGTFYTTKKYLDMTVTNRSNDLLWGMLGANYVHFSFLQEYMSARLGVGVGKYHHITNNLHVYTDRPDWRPDELLAADNAHWGASPEWAPTPLVRDPASFEQELPRFVETFSGNQIGYDPSAPVWREPFLWDVARPLLMAHRIYKMGDTDTALRWAIEIKADDWRLAATEWLKRRVKK